MAKQRGIHQISGKINNLCYYEQKYVRGGLIRRINEAMSERLKTDPAFTNTRHANAIFGGCSLFASTLLNLFGSRNTFLFKPYRHALLTKAVKSNLLTYESSSRYPFINNVEKGLGNLQNIVNNIVKNRIFDFFPGFPNVVYNLRIDSSYEFVFSFDSLTRFCEKFKCIGVQIMISGVYGVYGSDYNYESGKYDRPEVVFAGRGNSYSWYLQDNDGDLVISAGTGDIDDALTFWIIYAYPILSKFQNRPVFGETGACCGVVPFLAS